ncbi:MAG: hypothetical protein JOS17DRAFT_577014 [Linnemannia elongata]|nr:MAG: hypothetical protein JOS17DRAFT_577014 [Linnemannia elongata]
MYMSMNLKSMGFCKGIFGRTTTSDQDSHKDFTDEDLNDKNRDRPIPPWPSSSSPLHTPTPTPLPSSSNPPHSSSSSPPSSTSSPSSLLPTTPLGLSTSLSPSPSSSLSSSSSCSSPSSVTFSPDSPTPPCATTTTQQMKTRSRTPSPSSYNNTRNDNEGTLDIDHNNNYTTTSRHYSHTNTLLPSMTAFLSPLNSGTGGAAPAPETIIAGDNGHQCPRPTLCLLPLDLRLQFTTFIIIIISNIIPSPRHTRHIQLNLEQLWRQPPQKTLQASDLRSPPPLPRTNYGQDKVALL